MTSILQTHISKTLLHTIALTREAKLWEDTRDSQSKRRANGVRLRPPPGEVEGNSTKPRSVELARERMKPLSSLR